MTHGNTELVRLYLAAGVDPNQPSPKGQLPLEMAAVESHTEIARLLLEWGARPEEVPLLLFQAVYAAAFTDSFEIVELLASAGARLTDVDETTGFDALALAKDMGHPAVIKIVERLYDA